MPKYAFCDLDYTLLDDHKNISSDNLKAIKDFEAKGNHFIICTGRVPFVMKKYGDMLGSKDIVCANGAVIIIDNKEVKSEYLTSDIINIVLKYAIDNKIYTRIFSSSTLYIINMPEKDLIGTQLYLGYKVIENDKAFDIINNEKIIKMIFCDDNPDVLSKAYDYINKACQSAELTYSASFALEINKKGQCKGNGIKDYCKLKNIDIKDTISIGDNDNDITMFKTTGYSACPSNAIGEVKDIVNYVSGIDYNHSAIADILKHIEKNEK